MNLRLVLVCLVAGLGIGIPSRPDIEGWIATPRHRMQARIAELGDIRTDDADRAMIWEFRRFGIDGPRMARSWRIAPALLGTTPSDRTTEPEAPAVAVADDHPAPLSPPQTPATSSESTPSFEPIEVDDRMYVGIAYDLNYFGEGLGMLPKVAAPSTPPSSPVRPDELIEMAIARHGADAVRLVGRLGGDLNAIAARELVRESFLAMEESPDLYFDELIEEPTTVEVAATEPEPAAEAAPSPFDAMERSGSLYFAETLATAPAEAPALAAELPALPADPFAPAEINDEPAAVVAAAEAVHPPVESSTNPEPQPARRGDVTRAMSLTGQALAAWVNVFTKAPLVASSPAAANIR